MKALKKVVINIWELLIIITGVLSFYGYKFIGRNTDPTLFIILFALYGGMVAYKITARIQATMTKVKNGTWGNNNDESR